MYWKYLRYLLRHRWFVMLACFREGLYWQGLIHDWSKFLPGEFVPYARYFYGPKLPSIKESHGDHRQMVFFSGMYSERVEQDFNAAWLAHQHRNPHHWQHWVLREDSGATFALPMPHKYRVEMLCDWQGAGRAIHGRYDATDPYGETREWYKKNAGKMLLHDYTRTWVEAALGIERGGGGGMTCTCLYNNTAEGASSIHIADARCPEHGEEADDTQ